MLKVVSGLLLCAVSAGAANAALVYGSSEVYDSATGLTWSYLASEVGSSSPPLSAFTYRTDGKRLATGSELQTFFSDAGLSPLSGTYVFPNVPSGLSGLITWASGARTETRTGLYSAFIFAGDQPGYVGLGSFSNEYTGAADTYRYAAFISGASSLYAPIPGAQFGAALVTAAVPEPSTYLLMVLGLGAVGIVRRRA